ncbi:ROK family protein [Aestuariimicrobium sp. p3-SID1156]|uniref:ROK family transcriptional regulator n=1 Tax=Aestuariimicrobium sp. p3-SID1156 TaxID=2916038 RepID=UPI00223BD197|nr:ROK family transcriptional regulator [Aestuariimicrobium sp. p3-SID1156]MCT1458589.1 ROK family protein [Aestuariimicrobium sp. p3-SID1156]
MSLYAADPSSVRQWNEVLVLRIMNGSEWYEPTDFARRWRISELSEATGLTPATVRGVLGDLEEKNWIVVHDPDANSGRGRPAKLYSLKRIDAHILGLDFGPRWFRAQRNHLDNTIESRHEVRLPDNPTHEDRRQAVAELMEVVIGDTDPAGVWMTGVAVSGPVTPDGTIERSVAIPEWEGQHIADLFGDLIPGRLLIKNDIHAWTWAEHVAGVAKGSQEMLIVHLGRRSNFGVFNEGKVRRGAHDLAGDMSKQPELTTIVPRWMLTWKDEKDPYGAALQAAYRGEERTVQQLREDMVTLAKVVSLSACLIDPEVIVISGSFAPLAPIFIEDMRAALQESVQIPPKLMVSNFDQFGAALGAARLASHHVATQLVDETEGVRPLRLGSITH